MSKMSLRQQKASLTFNHQSFFGLGEVVDNAFLNILRSSQVSYKNFKNLASVSFNF